MRADSSLAILDRWGRAALPGTVLLFFVLLTLAPLRAPYLSDTLPLLPILVVSKETGRPGRGFPAVDDMDAERERVFAHNWFKMKPPTADDFKS